MTEVRDHLRLANDGFVISFCNVEAGREHEQARALQDKLPEALVCKVFGRPDFAVLQEWRGDFPSNPPLADVLELRQVHDFVTVRHDRHYATIAELRRYPLICVLLLKVDTSCECHRGFAGETLYLDALQARLDAAHPIQKPLMAAVSSLGWYESIVVIGCNQFQPVLDSIVRLSDVTCPKSGSRVTDGATRTTTLTYPCVSLSADDVSDAVLNDVSLRIIVSAQRQPDYERILSDALRASLGDSFDSLSTDFGDHDFTVLVKPVASSREYVQRLWAFRAAAKEVVNWTSTVVSIPSAGAPPAGDVQAESEVNGVPEPDHWAGRLLQRSPVGADVADVIRTYNSARAYLKRLWQFRSRGIADANQTPRSLASASPNSAPQLGRGTSLEVTADANTRGLPRVIRYPRTAAVHEIERKRPVVATELAYVIRTFNACVADPRLRHVGEELQPFLEDIITALGDNPDPNRSVANTNDGVYVRYPGFLGEQLELFDYGLTQRLWGTPLHFLHPVISFPLADAGIQRSLAAVSYLVKHMLAAAQQRWNGFVVAGFS